MDIRKAYYMTTGHIDGYYSKLGQGSEPQSFDRFIKNVILQRIYLRALGDKQDIDILDAYIIFLNKRLNSGIDSFFTSEQSDEGATPDAIDDTLFNCCPSHSLFKKYSQTFGEMPTHVSLQNFLCLLFSGQELKSAARTIRDEFKRIEDLDAYEASMAFDIDPTFKMPYDVMKKFKYESLCSRIWKNLDIVATEYMLKSGDYRDLIEMESKKSASKKVEVNRLESLKRFKQQTKEVFKNIVGQREQLARITKLLFNAELGLNGASGKGPKASMLLTGPTGVGKTETAHAISRALYGVEPFAVDLSVYSEKHQISTLIGSPPGYVGYSDTPALLTYIEKHQESGGVLLFDEFDKTNEAVRNIFMNMLDEGEIQSASGKNYSVKNFIIILTSNITEKVQSKIGFGTQKEDIRDTIVSAKVGDFPPELIARIDEVIAYQHLSQKEKLELAKRKMDSICKRIVEANDYLDINITYSDAVLLEIVDRVNESMGIRELFRMVKNMATSKLVEYIMENDEFTGLDICIESLSNVSITHHNGQEYVPTFKTKEASRKQGAKSAVQGTPKLDADDIIFRRQ